MIETISSEDLERHERMLARYREAQEIQEQVDRLVARQTALLGAWKIWCEELHERYDLPLDGFSGGVNEDGTITRRGDVRDPTVAEVATLAAQVGRLADSRSVTTES